MNCCCNENSSPLELKIKKGESLGFAFTLTKDGIPVDLTSAEMVLEVRDGLEDTGVYVISKTIDISSDPDVLGVITNPTEGKFFFKINSSDISSMSTTKPYYMAVYHSEDGVRDCISANNGQVAKFLVLNP